MARASSGGGGGGGTGGAGSRFASSNLNDLYGKQASIGSSAGSKSRYSHGGMLVLARPVRTPPGKQSKSAKLTVPAPVNLPSLRKEHAGNDPSITLVGGTGVSGWSKQQVLIQQASPLAAEDPALGDGHLKSNGWGVSIQVGGAGGNVGGGGGGGGGVDQSPRMVAGKYTPPSARGNVATTVAAPPAARASSAATAVVLRGEDFPTLQAAAPFNPVPTQQRQREIQQRQRDKQREIKQQQQKLQQLSQNSPAETEMEEDAGYKPPPSPSPVLALQPQSRQGGGGGGGGGGGVGGESERGYFSLKENRKPNGVSLRPGPLIHLNHTSNWADDERETASMSKAAPEWEDPPRYGQSPFPRPGFQRDERPGYRRDEYARREPAQDFGWDRDRGGGGGGDWRSSGFDRSEGDARGGSSWRMRESFGHHGRDSFPRESFFGKAGGAAKFGGVRNGGFPDLPVRVRSPYTDDSFMRDFPELPNLDLRLDPRNRLRKKREDSSGDSSIYRDVERETFESELERVQKEQEQERQRKIEERERAIELARKEEEERERVAREEEERRRRIEEESRAAAAAAEQEALDSVRKTEEAKRAREDEKRKMLEEEEKRKENARRKLLELEERIAKREMERKQPRPGPEPSSETGIPDSEDRARVSNLRVQQQDQNQTGSRLRSPEIMNSIGRDAGSRDRSRLSAPSWRRDLADAAPFPGGDHRMQSPGRRMPDEADSFFDGSGDNFRRDRDRDEKWASNNGDHYRSVFSPRPNDHGFEDDRRWNRRNRPFSPPSPTCGGGGGYDAPDGVSYGRLRQSLPKQPRVLPPPTRPKPSPFPAAASAPAPASEIREEFAAADSQTLIGKEIAPDEEVFEDESISTVGEEEAEISASAEGVAAPPSDVASIPAKFEQEISETVEEPDDEEQRSEISQEEALKGSGDDDEAERVELAAASVEIIEEPPETMAAAEVNATLSEMVESISIVVLPKVEATEDQAVDLPEAETIEDAIESAVATAAAAAAATEIQIPAPLLPSPDHGLQQHPFHHPPSSVPPLLDSRPRMQGPMPDRAMTIQFGLLPGTSLLQGSIPAIQIGSIQMPLQLHPPIGHHVAHLQPPPQFQFGQIGQQAPLLPSFTVHPQAMMQPPMMNIDQPGQHFRMQPHPDRTFWTHQFGQPGPIPHPSFPKNNDKQSEMVFEGETDSKRSLDEENRDQELWKQDGQASYRFQERSDSRQWPARQEGYSSSEGFRKKANRRNLEFRSPIVQDRGHYVPRKGGKPDDDLEKPSSERVFEASGGSEDDDFIEVRSRRQLQKDKQGKSKPKHAKQGAKQRNNPKPLPPRDSKSDTAPLQNCLDAVVTTSRSRQASLSNPEVGFEKRTRSPQPTQKNSLVPDAPAFPPIVADGQSAQVNGPGPWGFGRSNQEIQLEEAMKPARFEVPLPLQVPLSEHLSSGLESTPSVTAKDKGPRANAASGPVNSLLAGEKIQFGAVTMPAFASTVPWLGPSRAENFLGVRKELQDETELASFGKGKRSRENEDGTMDSEAEAEAAEAEAAASAVAVAAISNDDYLHTGDQLVPSHGAIGSLSNKSSPAGQTATETSAVDETINVSLPADLSVDMPLRGPPSSGPHIPSLPGSFPGMEMGTLLGGPVYAFGSGGEASRDSNGERPGGLNWQPRHGVDSFYGGPHGFAGPFINHGPIPSIPPHTLVYTSPFGGVGQFGQLGVSYLGPTHMPPVKQPDWKHTPTSSAAGGANGGDAGNEGGAAGMHYTQQGNRHLAHDPSVISVVPPGPFDLYRDMAFQSQWSHVPGPHQPMSGPIPGFPPMHHMRHPHPAYHIQQQADHINDSYMAAAANAGAAAAAAAEASDQYLEELGLGDAMSTSSSDANAASFAVHQHQQHQHQHQHHQQHQHQQHQQQQHQVPAAAKSPNPASIPKLRSRVVMQPANGTLESGGGGGGSRPNSGSSRPGSASAAQSFHPHPHSYVATAAAAGPRRSAGHQEKRSDRSSSAHQQGGAAPKIGAPTGWSSQGRKGGFAGDSSGKNNGGGGGSSSSSPSMMASKLKQVYVVKPPPAAAAAAAAAMAAAKGGGGGGDHLSHAASEVFSADARHM